MTATTTTPTTLARHTMTKEQQAAYLVPCPHCLAGVDEDCRRPSGVAVAPHAKRVKGKRPAGWTSLEPGRVVTIARGTETRTAPAVYERERVYGRDEIGFTLLGILLEWGGWRITEVRDETGTPVYVTA